MTLLDPIKQYILARPKLRNLIVPTYILLRAPYYLIRFGTLDVPEYFIFKGKDLIYLVNPKVAQTTIKNTCGNKHKKEYAGIQETHLAESKKVLSKEEKQYFAFTMVRNPFDRLYSCYCSKYIADKEKSLKEVLDFDYYLGGLIKKDKGFAHFVRMVSRIPDCLADRHFKSQHALIHRQSRTTIDYIGKYEQLADDFEIVRKRFDLEELPHLNPSGKKDWRAAYTPELIDLVAKRYKKDLEIWYPDAEQDVREYIKKHAQTTAV